MFTEANKMEPGAQPEVLKNLTAIEEMLIAKIHPVIRLYRIRGQQFGYSGHVVNFAQNVTDLSRKLPVDPRSLDGLIIVNRDTPDGVTSFKVRASKVRDALFWLKRNPGDYHDIEIDEEQLSILTLDGDIRHLLPNLNQENRPCEQSDDVVDDQSSFIEESNFPFIPQLNQQERITEEIGNERENHLNWPDIARTPINEFNTEGYITQAFPTLFPYGRADYRQNRNAKVNFLDYFKYLLQFKDGRFAKDSRFRFFAFNSIMRWQAIRQGNLYVKRNAFGDVDAETISERIAANPFLADSIMFHAGKLRSSKSYWGQRSGELHDMVDQLSTPHIFFTLSAADYHWPDLYKLLNPQNNIDISIVANPRKLMHDNPLITAWFFQKRAENFVKEIMIRCFGVVDYWYRYEWQWRGSPHIHGVLWLKDGPNIENLDNISDDQLAYLTDFCAKLSRAWNPNASQPPSDTHPSCKRFSEIMNDPEDLTTILNRLQRHTRCGSHCLRKKKNSRVEKCRFGFPHTLTDEDTIAKEENYKFFPKRNDEFISNYNPYITQIWRGNTDFTPILSKKAVLIYLVKYATKAETESRDYRDILKSMAESTDPDSPAATIIRSLLISTTAERDFSAQEVCHLLMSWPLFHASRSFVSLIISDTSWRRLLADTEEAQDPAIIERYKKRGPAFENMTLFAFARDYRYSARSMVKRRKESIVRVFPKLKLTDDPRENEKYYKIKCVLHIPWRTNYNDLIINDSNNQYPWNAAYNRIRNLIEEPDNPEVEDSFEDDPELDEFQIHYYPEMAISRGGPILTENERIGRRDIDIAHHWEENSVTSAEKNTLQQWLANTKENYVFPQNVSRNVQFCLSDDQQRVMEIALLQIHELKTMQNVNVKRVMVQGKAGSGKSYLINAITQKFREELCFEAVELLAPTGAAAINICGRTIHSLLCLSPKGSKKLQNETLRKFQLKMSKVKVIIIDEMSMIGLRFLNQISMRLQEASGNSDEPFGNFIIYFFGDMRQLPPVRNNAMYSNAEDPQSNKGKLLITTIQVFIALTTNHRQSGEQQQQFRDILDAMTSGNLSESQFQLLNTRRMGILSSHEKKSFDNALRLLPTNKLTNDFNDDHLRRCGYPVADIPSENSSNAAKRQGSDKAQSLEPILKLARGCRVMLRYNLWTEAGLVNGALGTLTSILYESGQRPPTMPVALLIQFDNYRGPCYSDNSIPIVPITWHWKSDGNDCWRKQFPINVAHAVTIHKSQGLTLDKAVINIGETEKALGVSYVAFSRVRTLTSLIIDQVIDLERLNKICNSPQFSLRNTFLEKFSLL